MPTTPQLFLTCIQLGNSATPANNFFVKVPDTADGSLTIERVSGTPVLSINAAGQVTFPGNAQTIQDMSGSRASGTPYTNNTGQTITVMVCMSSTSMTSLEASVDGKLTYGTGGSSGGALGIVFPVPAGKSYSCRPLLGTPTLFSWLELR